MTKEKAIEQLEWYFEEDNGISADLVTKEAFNTIIQALSQEPTVQDKQAESEKHQKAFDDGYANGYAQARFDYEQEPCDECVYSTKDGYCQYDDISETIPPLEPCETCGYAEGSPFCLQYCPYDAERKQEQEPTERELERDYLLQSFVEALKTLQAENDDLKEKLKQEPCDDAISRDAVIERLKKEDKILYTTTGLNYLIRVIEGLPPVTPTCEEREKGECPYYAG